MMKLLPLALIPFCYAASCSADNHMPNLSLDFEGGFFQNNDAFTTYGGLGHDATDRVQHGVRNVKQNNKFSWGAGVSHLLDSGYRVRASYFMNDHRNRDRMYGGSGTADAISTERLPVDIGFNDAREVQASVAINNQTGAVTLAKVIDFDDVQLQPRAGIERSQVKYVQYTNYKDIDQGVSYKWSLVKETSRLSGIGATFGMDMRYRVIKDWFLNASGDVSVLSGDTRTTFQTKNNAGRDDYDQKSLDKRDIFQHYQTRLSVMRDFKVKYLGRLNAEMGYRYDSFPSTIKLHHFRDDNNSEMVSTTTLENFSYQGSFLKLTMDVL